VINPWFVRRVSYPWLFKVFTGESGRGIMDHVARWETQSRWPAERHAEEAWKRVQRLLRHAWDHSPLHRERMQAAGAEPGDLKGWDDFARLPRMTREDLDEGLEGFLADNISPSHRTKTRSSGSTGRPAWFWIDRGRAPLNFANYHLNMRWMGAEVGNRQAWMWPDAHGPSGRGTWQKRFASRLLNRLLLMSPDLSDDVLRIFHERLMRFRPGLIVSFPTRVAYFLKFCERHGLQAPQVPRMISTGECLTPEQRRWFSDAFGTEIFDRYGSIELGDVAHECGAHEGLHINTHRVWVETVDAPGLEGDQRMLVITDLDNLSTPFIRYEVGDLGRLWPTESTNACPCGRTLPRLASVTGRVRDALEAPSGNAYARVVYVKTAQSVPGVGTFQIIQRKPNRLVFRTVVDERFPEDGCDQLARHLNRMTRGEFEIDVEIVDEIPLSPSGKLKIVIRE
jgi:phenylacetate-CoA ligase